MVSSSSTTPTILGSQEINHLDQELPTYEPLTTSAAYGAHAHAHAHERSAPVEHISSLTNSAGVKRMTLRLLSSALTAESVPMFLGDEKITGCIDLDLRKPESIEAVILKVKGIVRLSTPFGMKPIPIYEFKEPLWTSPQGKAAVKLLGLYSWNFSTSLPHDVIFDEVKYKELQLSGVQHLPPHFSEQRSMSIISYQLGITIKRKGLFAGDQALITNFGYIPRSKPDPPSPLRQMAYQEETPVLGPVLDPLGWKVFPEIEVKGTLFNAKKVTLKCSLALALPLNYTRGTTIPCSLTIESSDTQALDVLSSFTAPQLELRREINEDNGVTHVADNVATVVPDVVSPVAVASWAPAPGHAMRDPDSSVRVLSGEISLPSHLIPTFSFGQLFYTKYFVDLVSFKAAGFVAASKDRILRTEVGIATDYANGPHPRRYLPPGYN